MAKLVLAGPVDPALVAWELWWRGSRAVVFATTRGDAP